MIKFKKSTKPIKELPKLGDTTTKRKFLWWPYLHTDGNYYWLGFVTIIYTYRKTIIPMWPFGYVNGKAWIETEVII